MGRACRAVGGEVQVADAGGCLPVGAGREDLLRQGGEVADGLGDEGASGSLFLGEGDVEGLLGLERDGDQRGAGGQASGRCPGPLPSDAGGPSASPRLPAR
jgi:hypothetical protein